MSGDLVLVVWGSKSEYLVDMWRWTSWTIRSREVVTLTRGIICVIEEIKMRGGVYRRGARGEILKLAAWRRQSMVLLLNGSLLAADNEACDGPSRAMGRGQCSSSPEVNRGVPFPMRTVGKRRPKRILIWGRR